MKTSKARLLVTRHLSLVTAALLFFSASAAFAQGSLTPSGAPAPTMKTLDQLEPRIDLFNAPASAVTTTDAAYHFIITQPGSYYLSANLGVAKTNGIQINAEGVTLDLNGFQISRSFATFGNGIEIAATSHRAAVRNGSIIGFGTGVNSPGGSPASACAFRDLAVSGCTVSGIVAGRGAVLETCRAHNNSGSYGIFTASGSTLTNCTAQGNTGSLGIYAFDGSTLTGCSALGNRSSAVSSAGILTGNGCTISRCTSFLNSSSAAASPLTGRGLDVGARCTIENCTATENYGDGINIASQCLVRANTCSSNGAVTGGDGAGIHTTGSDTRIEGNNVINNSRGIDIGGAHNLIIKNSAAGNGTNYVFVANNVFGAVVDRTAPASAAVSGNTAASSAGTTDPWANFSY